MEDILVIEGLNVHYGDFQAIHDVGITVSAGKITSIIGSNGAGKTTLLNAVMGIHPPDAGSIIFDGKDITNWQTNRIVACGMTMSPEGSNIFEDMSVEENLLIGAYLPEPRKKIDELLGKAYKLFPMLREKSNQLATFLSGGQRQMLAIARSLMSDPKVLICDEVSLGLAPIIIGDIYEKIAEINESGVTVVLVEQEVKRSLEHSDFSYVLVKGHVVLGGKSSELPEEEVKDAYFGINEFS